MSLSYWLPCLSYQARPIYSPSSSQESRPWLAFGLAPRTLKYGRKYIRAFVLRADRSSLVSAVRCYLWTPFPVHRCQRKVEAERCCSRWSRSQWRKKESKQVVRAPVRKGGRPGLTTRRVLINRFLQYEFRWFTLLLLTVWKNNSLWWWWWSWSLFAVLFDVELTMYMLMWPKFLISVE